MFKIISGIIVSLLIVIVATFLLLFTNSGNMFLKPYIGKYISKKTGFVTKIDSFTLKPSFLDMQMNVNNSNEIVLNGDINILKKKFNLIFMIKAKDPIDKNNNETNAIDINGTLCGTLSDFEINGKGKMFKSNIDFKSKVIKMKVKNLHLIMNEARIGKILSLLGKPPFISGVANINIDFNSLNLDNLSGNAKITIPYGSVNTDIIKKDFNITLPPSIIFQAKINSVLNNKTTVSTINLSSNILKLNTTKTIFNIKNKNFQSDYSIDIPNLSLLKKLTKIPLKGSFDGNGEIEKKDKIISYTLSTFSFGGDMSLFGNNTNLNINANSIKLDKLLSILNLPKYSFADIDIKGDIQNFKNAQQNGKINVNIKNGKINQKLIYKDFNISTPDNFSYNVNSIYNITPNKVTINSELNSSVGNLKVFDTSYILSSKQLNGKCDLNISDMKKISFLTKRKIIGKADFSTNFKYYNDILTLSGKTDVLDSNTTYNYENGDIDINSTNFNTLKFSQALGYPAIFDSQGTFYAQYNPKWQKGIFSLNFQNGKLIPNKLTNLIYTISGFDMTKEIYKNGTVKGNIQNNLVNFMLDMNSSKSMLSIYNGVLNNKTKDIQGNYKVKIGDKDIEGEIAGSLNHIKVKINSSSYIKNKIEKIIDKKVPKKFQQPLKEILNLFGK